MGCFCKVLIKIFTFLRYYFETFYNWLFDLYYNSKKRRVGDVKDNLLLESAISLAKKVREGNLKSEVIVRAFIERIIEVNPLLNAVVENRFDDAINEAKEIDKNIANGIYTEDDFNEKPFLGIPFTSKESTKCKGMKHTLAMKKRKDVVSIEDAPMIARMKNAGGILLATTNVPQFNMWCETNNPLYGRTNNPYDVTRTAGGACGGEGSIVAACGSPIGLGTDTLGSIRIPSNANGLFGFKSTPNLVPIKCRPSSEEPTILSPGPIAKYMEDVEVAFKVLIGPKIAYDLNLNENIDLKQINLFYSLEIEDPLISKLRPTMKDCVERVVQCLNIQLGKEAELVNFENMKYTTKLWAYQLKQENGGKSDFSKDIADKKKSVGVMEALWKMISQNEYSFPVLYNLLKNILLPTDDEKLRVTLDDLKKEMEDKLGNNGILVFPSWPFPLEHHNVNLLRPVNAGYTSIWNVLQFPVLQVPIGLSKNGTPLGVQIISTTNQDRLCLIIGKILEKSFGGYVPPFNVSKNV